MRQCPTRILACGRVSGFLHTIFLPAHNVHVTTQPPPGYSALRRWPFRPPPDEKESGSFHGSWQPVRDLPVVEPHFPGCSAHLPYHVYHSAIAESSGSPPKKTWPVGTHPDVSLLLPGQCMLAPSSPCRPIAGRC